MKRYDVVVAGGGFAGFCAAVSAAQGGSRVLLIEKGNCLGGAACAGLVFPFMPYFTTNPEKGKREYLVEGLFGKIIEEMRKLYPKTDDSHFHEEYLKLVLNRMALQAGVELLFHATVMGVQREGKVLKSVSVAGPGGITVYAADIFVDCTGNGDVAALSGCSFCLGRTEDHLCQPMTLCFRVGGVDVSQFYREKGRLTDLYKQWQKAGKIQNCREDILVFTYVVDRVLHFNSTRIVKLDPTDTGAITKAEILSREQVFELFFFLKENAKSFENAEILSTASEIGVRESRMVTCEYLLTQEDLIGCTKFEDAICCGNYDIDIHNPEGSGTSHFYFAPGTYYTVPYRSLCAKDVDNLLVAGRCIGATHEAQASVRIMPICAALGQAAGTAAALALEMHTSIKAVDIQALQGRLHAAGARTA